ncbi:MAG: hypothetical protein M3Y24_09245 [Acidobacteriota bacterium]|nr:hypothetical protein [Acidobacteriota bacterium]
MWKQVLALSGDRWVRFTANYVPDYGIIWAVVLDVACLAVLIFALMIVRGASKSYTKAAANTLLALFCAVALYEPVGIIAAALTFHRLRFLIFTIVATLAGIALLSLAVMATKRTIRDLRRAFLIFAPIFPLLLFNCLYQSYSARRHWAGNGMAAGMLPSKSRERLIWVIFDELDRRMLYNARPQRVQLPEFDRLQRESLDALAVNSPAMNTSVSIPSLLLEKNIDCVEASAKGGLLIKERDSTRLVPFDSQEDVFEKARAAGFNTGVSGWYFPYCRMVGHTVSECAWALGGFELGFVHTALTGRPIYQQGWYLAKWQLNVLPHLTRPLSEKPEQDQIFRQGNIHTLQIVLQNALRMLEDHNLNLVFIHLPIPHPPGIWDPTKGAFTTANANYLDNLELADKVLGQIRHTLEDVGDWERSTILISSDHPFRSEAWTGPSGRFEDSEMNRVSREEWFPFIPFLLNLPYQHQHVTYKGSFNSVLTGDLVLSILKRQLTKPEDVVNWLNTNGKALSAGAEPKNSSLVCGE